MAVKRCKRPERSFSMSSMTDVVFLLLIFFMVTSTLINPNALQLVLPKSTNQTSQNPVATVSIDKNKVFYLNTHITTFSQLEKKLKEVLKGVDDPCVSIAAEHSVPIEEVVKVMNIAKRNNYRTILATQPE